MSTIVPPTTPQQLPHGQGCAEFFGIGRGYCPSKGEVADSDGRRFCAPHARARGVL